MDPVSPSMNPLPPVTGPAPAMPAFGNPGTPNGAPMQPVTPRPVGRPSADPEIDNERVMRGAEARRIEAIKPKHLDSKVLVFRIKQGRPSVRPCLQILLSDIEKAVNDGLKSEDYIGDCIEQKGFTSGRFLCRFVDRAGKTIAQYPPFEMNLNEDGSENEGEEEEEEFDDEPAPFAPQPAPSFQPNIPPAPPAMNLEHVTNALRSERTDESRRSNDVMLMLTTMMQAQAQQQQQAHQQMLAMQQQARAEADAREERERNRKSDFHKTLMGMIPIALPVIQSMFAPKDKGNDPVLAVILEMVKGKSSDGDLLKQTSAIMGEMVKSQMQLQGAGAAAAVNQMAEVNGMVVKNMMGTMKEMMDGKMGLNKEEPSMLSQIAEIAKAVIPAMQQQAGEPATLETAAAPAVAAPAAQAPAAAVPVRHVKTPPPAAKRGSIKDLPDTQRIALVLGTIRQMSMGKPAPEKRFEVLVQIAQAMPPAMQQAVHANDRQKVMDLGTPIVAGSKVLVEWISVEHNQQFLNAVLDDLHLMLNQKMTQEVMTASVEKHVEFLIDRAKEHKIAQTDHPDTAENGSVVGEAPPAAAAAEVPAEAKPVETIPGPGAAPRGKIPPPPPPAAPEG